MLPGEVLDKFIERCLAAVMVRATVERLLRPERLDEIFEAPRSRQSEREIVCSELVALMVGVATRTHQSVHAAYLAARQTLGVSAAAVSGKRRCFEPRVTAALVRDTAIDMAEVIASLPQGRRSQPVEQPHRAGPGGLRVFALLQNPNFRIPVESSSAKT